MIVITATVGVIVGIATGMSEAGYTNIKNKNLK
jgi:hypothetical protein